MMLGDRIKLLRQFKDMTQDQLVNGIASVAYLSKVENGLAKPSAPFLLEISKKLCIEACILQDPKFYINIEEKVTEIFHNYWKRKIMSENDICLIKLLSVELQSNTISLMVFSTLIRFYYSNSRLQEAIETYNLSTKIVQVNKEDTEFSYYYLFSCGVLHFEIYDYQKANGYFLKSEEFLPNDVREKARLYYNLSLVNERINKDKSICLLYSEKAYDSMIEAGDINRSVNILLVRSIQYLSTNELDKSLECQTEAQRLYNDNLSDNRLKSSIIYSFGKISQLRGDFVDAITYFKEYIEIIKDAFPEKMIKGYKRLAEVYIELRDWENVSKYIGLAKELANSYKKVFFDIEVKLLEIYTFQLKQQDEKYEKEMQRLIEICDEMKVTNLRNFLSKELGVYYFNRQAYKKSALYFMNSMDTKKNDNDNILNYIQYFS